MTVKKNFDSDFCGSLPLNHINSIQDYGYLVILEKKSLNIIQVSENTTELLGADVKDLIQKEFSAYTTATDLAKIAQLIHTGLLAKVPLMLTIKNPSAGEDYHALLHIKPDYLILELEKIKENRNRSFSEVFQDIKYISTAIEQAETVQQVCDVAVHELRKLSGFDGVLMYRFDQDWNGTVIAEEKDDRLDPYLGQTFPASDVPKQARQLYLKNPYRLIPNGTYQQSRLYPVINPLTNTFTDLSDCNLRGVAAVHLEYMKHMKIKASMSIRVIHNEKLWGLISCHHISEKYLDYELCAIFEWLSAVISNRVALILNKEEFALYQALQLKRLALTDQVYHEGNLSSGLLKDDSQDILSLFSASGALVCVDGKIEKKGIVPKKDALDNLMLWLEGKKFDKVYASHHLSELYEEASEYANMVSGLLFIPIDSNKSDFVVCFRREVVEEINWGGDPNQAINFEKDGKSYHPRNSFKMWKQTVHQYALPWSIQELEVAESLRSFLFEFRTKQLQE